MSGFNIKFFSSNNVNIKKINDLIELDYSINDRKVLYSFGLGIKNLNLDINNNDNINITYTLNSNIDLPIRYYDTKWKETDYVITNNFKSFTFNFSYNNVKKFRIGLDLRNIKDNFKINIKEVKLNLNNKMFICNDFNLSLMDLILSKNNSDKFEIGYSLLYDELFGRENKKILEIGLNVGGPEHNIFERKPEYMPSIFSWLNYFDENSKIYGFDYSDFSHFGNLDRFTFIRGDQGVKNDLLKIKDKTHDLDYIIDDGSHASYHQQLSFVILFPILKSKGIYIIEDLNWQPADYEKSLPKVPLTKNLFIDLQNNSDNHIFETELKNLSNYIDYIKFECFDSKRNGYNMIIIKKK